MSAIYPLSVHRRIERQWAERIKSLRQMRGQTVIGTERTVQRVFYNEGPVILVPGTERRAPAKFFIRRRCTEANSTRCPPR